MIKRSHIRQFLALVEAESFTIGASRIHVTQPTLSAGIADLERLLGSKLFLRDKRKIRLTDSGRRFLAIAREIDQQFKVAERFSKRTTRHWPDIRLGLLRTLSGPMVELLLKNILEKFSIEVSEGDDAELRNLRNEDRLDAIITLKRGSDTEKEAQALFSEPYQMFVPNGHSLANMGEIEPELLAGEVMIARRNCEILRATSHFFTRHGVRPLFALRSDNDERCMRLVAAGAGLTTAPLSFQLRGTTPINVSGYSFLRTIALLASPSFAETISYQSLVKTCEAMPWNKFVEIR